MTFGKVKTIIEKNLIESYKNEAEFKKSLREFKQNVLNNKSFSKLYSLYDQLSTPQGLSESDAKEFLAEGISLINRILSNVKLPKSLNESDSNSYNDIDILVYTNKLDLNERMIAKKNIIEILSKPKQTVKESINIPIKSMVKIANQTLENYVDNMDENSKKIFIDVIKNDNEKLKENFSSLKEKTLEKLNSILNEQKEKEVIEKINETIDRLKLEEYNQINYVKLIDLDKNL